jgi:hypothetical protein
LVDWASRTSKIVDESATGSRGIDGADDSSPVQQLERGQVTFARFSLQRHGGTAGSSEMVATSAVLGLTIFDRRFPSSAPAGKRIVVAAVQSIEGRKRGPFHVA